MKTRGQAVMLLNEPPEDATALRRPVVLVPGEAVPVLAFEAPARASKRALERIARFSLAEKLADDPAKLHMVCLARKGEAPVAFVVGRTQLETWLAELGGNGVAAAALVPDYLAPDWQPGNWTIVHQGNRTIVRTGEVDGFCAEPDLAAAVLSSKLDGEGKPLQVHLSDLRASGAAKDAIDDVVARAGEAGAVVMRDTQNPFAQEELPDLAMNANLMTGQYRPFSGALKEARRWRAVGIAAAIVLVLLAVSGYADLVKRENELTALDGEIETLYRSAFDQTGPMVNVRAQAERELARLRGGASGAGAGNDLTGLLQRAGPALTSTDWQVQSIEFHDGTLFVNVEATSFEALDRLRNGLQGAALAVETVRSSASATGAEAQLAVKGT